MLYAGRNLEQILQVCLLDIGGGDNADVQNYIASRDSEITRAILFEKATRTIWMAGLTRKAVRGLLRRAQANGFRFDFAHFGCLTAWELARFIQQMHGMDAPHRPTAKWQAVHSIARWLSTFPSEEAFQQAIFRGKKLGKELDAGDVRNVTALRLPYLRCANVSHTLRGIGGEFVKNDRWIGAFLHWGRLTQPQLETRLQGRGIPLGFFDLVIWAYCEKSVKRTVVFDEHFTRRFGHLT